MQLAAASMMKEVGEWLKVDVQKERGTSEE